MDEQLTMKKHITNKFRIAIYNIQKIILIRPMLTEDATKTILLGTVISHLDYTKQYTHWLTRHKLQKASTSSKYSC